MVNKLWFVLLSVLLFSGTAFAIEFSADTVTTVKDGPKITGKIYYKPDRFKMDMQADEGMSMIARLDKKIAWNIMESQKMYMEMPLDLKYKPKVDEKFEGEIERKEVGSETIDGHPTKKYLITFQANDKKNQVFQWLATDIKFPVRTAAIDNSWVQEFRNIKIGPQPDSLFEVPAGYQKMQMPQMPGGMNFMHSR
jgi:hypothetical protein